MSELKISGKWRVEEEFWVERPKKGRRRKAKPYEVIIHQNGQSITMEIDEVERHVLGKLDGNTAVMEPFSYPEEEGMTKVVKFDVEFSNDGNIANHQDTWIWESNYGRDPKEEGKTEGQWTRKVSSIFDVDVEAKKKLEIRKARKADLNKMGHLTFLYSKSSISACKSIIIVL